jgi:hypothetical protein
MAYVSQELKAKLAPKIKAICKKHGVRASIAVRNHSTLVLNIKQGQIDFIGNYNKVVGSNPLYLANPQGFRKAEGSIDVNTSWYQEHFSGKAKEFIAEMITAMEGPDYFDHSDIQSDYFHRSHYIDINIGQWNKPYTLEA